MHSLVGRVVTYFVEQFYASLLLLIVCNCLWVRMGGDWWLNSGVYLSLVLGYCALFLPHHRNFQRTSWFNAKSFYGQVVDYCLPTVTFANSCMSTVYLSSVCVTDRPNDFRLGKWEAIVHFLFSGTPISRTAWFSKQFNEDRWDYPTRHLQFERVQKGFNVRAEKLSENPTIPSGSSVEIRPADLYFRNDASLLKEMVKKWKGHQLYWVFRFEDGRHVFRKDRTLNRALEKWSSTCFIRIADYNDWQPSDSVIRLKSYEMWEDQGKPAHIGAELFWECARIKLFEEASKLQ